MWPFRKKRVDIKSAQPIGVHLMPVGTYEQMWQRQQMPSPGAENMSWETLGLVETGIIAQGIAARQPYGWISNPVVYLPGQSAYLWGLPTVSGQFVQQPLSAQR